MPEIAACDFFTVPTVTFRILYVFIVLRHDRGRVVHFNVTTNPSAEWTAQQIVDAFPYEEVPRFLIRDRDGIYGDHFTKRVESMGIEEVPIAPHSPWQNPYCERVIGSVRRECLNLHDRAQRRPSLPHPHGLLRLLSRFQATSVAGSQLTDTTHSGTAIAGRGHIHSASRRFTSSILACCVIVNICLPGRFSATGLHVTVKRPRSCGILGLFVEVFSVVTQFDVCPVGWYNCRTEFLRGTSLDQWTVRRPGWNQSVVASVIAPAAANRDP